MRVWTLLIAMICSLLVSGKTLADSATFEMSNSVDDTRAWFSSTPSNANVPTESAAWFGKYTYLTVNYDIYSFLRWPFEIPRASKITASNISFKAAYSYSSSFNTTINYLQISGSPAWRGANGFAVANYADGTAMLAISRSSTSVAWNGVAAWTAESWYDSPDISTLMQEVVNDLANYDPISSTDKYAGVYIDNGDGAYADNDTRSWYQYDSGAANATELDVTYDPWGEVRTGSGYKYDSACSCMRYFDY